MRRPRPESAELCIYCNVLPGTDPDHVPPKSYFEPPRPDNLITVPCCRLCNQSFSNDDEYLRHALSVRNDVMKDSRWSALQRWRKRLWARPRSARLRDRLLGSSREVMVRTPGGVILGKTAVVELEVPRMHRLMRRYIAALYYHETKERLPKSVGMTFYGNFEGDEEAQHEVSDMLGGVPWTVIGRGEFKYRWNVAFDNPHSMVWLLAFYDLVPLLALTGPDQLGEGVGTSPTR